MHAGCRYVHRVGRTARLGRAGAAYLFLMPAEVPFAEQLEPKGRSVHRQDVQPLLQALPLLDSASQVRSAAA